MEYTSILYLVTRAERVLKFLTRAKMNRLVSRLSELFVFDFLSAAALKASSYRKIELAQRNHQAMIDAFGKLKMADYRSAIAVWGLHVACHCIPARLNRGEPEYHDLRIGRDVIPKEFSEERRVLPGVALAYEMPSAPKEHAPVMPKPVRRPVKIAPIGNYKEEECDNFSWIAIANHLPRPKHIGHAHRGDNRKARLH